ncbi:hypothetical protein Tco_0387807 [Tanacetum coccineum]
MVSQKMSYIKWCLLKLTLQAPFLNVHKTFDRKADQASVFMAMTFEQRSSSLVLHQMMSDHNSLDLAPQRQMVSAENNTLGPVPQCSNDV